MDDYWKGEDDLDRALTGVPEREARIVLVHEPDFADTIGSCRVDLQISGHSHGGQVRLPLIGALHLPPLGRKYPIGLQKAGRTQVYTNRGLGTTGPPVRFNCPPEVTLLRVLGA